MVILIGVHELRPLLIGCRMGNAMRLIKVRVNQPTMVVIGSYACVNVLEGRKKAGKEFTKDELKKYAGGRIWTGRTAKEIGLIDEVGTLEDAIAYAKKKANLEGDVEIWTQPKGKGSFLDSLFDVQVTAKLQTLIQRIPGLQKQLQAIDMVTRHPTERLWLLIPYAINGN